jgi:hypothetical protein
MSAVDGFADLQTGPDELIGAKGRTFYIAEAWAYRPYRL